MRQLKALGVQLSIDDFGTGYSSLAYFKDFGRRLKIDKSFVQPRPASGRSRHRRANDLATELGLDMVAEGIESSGLGCIGCARLRRPQGYYMSRPLPLQDALAFALRAFADAGAAAAPVS